jgi:L-fucose mutarotase
MLKNIPKILTPDALKALAEMGHGDELVIADGNFPASSICRRVGGPVMLRADGHGGLDILRAVMCLLPLDTYSDPNVMFQAVVPGDKNIPTGDPPIWALYREAIEKTEKPENIHIGTIERFAFYERAAKAFCVIATGEAALYANIIIKKGVIQ